MDYGPQYEPYNPVQTTNTFDGGSSSNFNPNSLVDSIFASLGPTLQGIGSIIYATKADGTPGGMPTYGVQPITYSTPQPTTANSNTAMYIGIAVLVLLLVLAAAFFLKK